MSFLRHGEIYHFDEGAIGLSQITHLQVVGRDSDEVKNISKQFLADTDRRALKLPSLHAQGFSDFVRQEQVDFLFKD